MPGRLPSSGSISIGQINAHEGYSPTQTTSMNTTLIRAFCGARVTNSQKSLGSARGKQVTVIGTLSCSPYSSSVTMPTAYLSTYFSAGQTATGYPLYTTVNVDEQAVRKTFIPHKHTDLIILLVVAIIVAKAQVIVTGKLPYNTLV